MALLEASPITLPLPLDTSGAARLKGTPLRISRIVWMALVSLAVILFLMAIPFAFADILRTCEGIECQTRLNALSVSQAEELAAAGIAPELWAGAHIALQVILVVVSVGVAVIIYRQRSDDWVSLALSAMLVTYGVYNAYLLNSLGHSLGWTVPLIEIVVTFGFALFWTFGYYFPTGRFAPRWTIIVVAIAILDIVIDLIRPYPGRQIGFPRGNFNVYIFGSLFGILAQVYRYLRISTPAQRRQSAWVLAGLAGLILLRIIGLTAISVIAAVPSRDMAPIIALFAFNLIFNVTALLLPVTFGIAITRYRLWDIDFLLNRTLVYAIVTAILGGVFALGFVGLNALLTAVIGNEQPLISIGLPIVAVMALFSPTQKRVRRFIDRRFGIKLDYVEAIKSYEGGRRKPRANAGLRTQFGDYRSLHLLGRGGMGEVYRAQHPTLGHSVAIKIIGQQIDASDESRHRFTREAQTIARLKHPNIVSIHDFGELDATPYMVMEHIEGQTLSSLLKERGRIPFSEAVPVLTDIAAALDYAHGQGIVHRDVKPSNVILESITATGSGRTQRAVLLDFGIAKVLAGATQLTHKSGMIGTLDYISPEQIQGAAEVDARADIYSFGVMTYQILTGEMPFKHNNPGAMVMAHMMQPPPDPRLIVHDLTHEAADAVMRAMAKKPEQRFATAGTFVDALCAGSED